MVQTGGTRWRRRRMKRRSGKRDGAEGRKKGVQRRRGTSGGCKEQREGEWRLDEEGNKGGKGGRVRIEKGVKGKM